MHMSFARGAHRTMYLPENRIPIVLVGLRTIIHYFATSQDTHTFRIETAHAYIFAIVCNYGPLLNRNRQ